MTLNDEQRARLDAAHQQQQDAERAVAETIVELADEGVTNADLAAYYDVTRGRGWQIVDEARRRLAGGEGA